MDVSHHIVGPENINSEVTRDTLTEFLEDMAPQPIPQEDIRITIDLIVEVQPQLQSPHLNSRNTYVPHKILTPCLQFLDVMKKSGILVPDDRL